MEYEFDNMMHFDKLGLYYEAHLAGIDGECFFYNVYFEDEPTDKKLEETQAAVGEFLKPYVDKDIYMGYIDITKDDGKISIYLDLGNVGSEYEQTSIDGILKALNNVSGIVSVILNEDSGFDF
ncbi:MAG: hypothetical protein J1F03_08925 [Oscillospiraceae bacterium]|nr:hypothetical protein [Oscillospiraceae bacterium]